MTYAALTPYWGRDKTSQVISVTPYHAYKPSGIDLHPPFHDMILLQKHENHENDAILKTDFPKIEIVAFAFGKFTWIQWRIIFRYRASISLWFKVLCAHRSKNVLRLRHWIVICFPYCISFNGKGAQVDGLLPFAPGKEWQFILQCCHVNYKKNQYGNKLSKKTSNLNNLIEPFAFLVEYGETDTIAHSHRLRTNGILINCSKFLQKHVSW